MKVSELQAALVLQQMDKKQRKQQIEQMQGDIAKIKGDVMLIKGDVTGLKADVEELKADTDALKNYGNFYGVTFAGSVSEGVRTGAAAGMVFEPGTDTTYGRNSFDAGYPWAGMRRCCCT